MIVDFDEYKEHVVQEVVCLKCLQRWVAVYPSGTWLKDIECPNCHEQGFVIATGQEINRD